jgi:hydroxypyruvate isomerase
MRRATGYQRVTEPEASRPLAEAVAVISRAEGLPAHGATATRRLARLPALAVALQYDVFHMQRMEGNLATIREHIDLIAHVQIADAPGRGEPGTGEIRFAYLFDVLDELGYEGWIGAEYKPTTDRTESGLSWLADHRPHRQRLTS